MLIADRTDGQARDSRRLDSLGSYAIMDTPREAAFDEIADLAARLTGCPIALVNLIGNGRQFFKAEVGLGVRTLPIDQSFCTRAIADCDAGRDFLLIPDAAADPAFADHPLVTGPRALRFYAGAVLRTPDGVPLGALCVLDAEPRDLTALQRDTLVVLAHQVMGQLELRRAGRERAERDDRYATLFRSMDEGFCIIEFIDGPHGPLSDYVHVEANAAYAANAGIPDVVGKRLREIVGDEAEAWLARYGAVLETGVPIRFEQELEATGRYLSLSAFRIEPASRREVAVLFQDITARRRAEVALERANATLEVRVAATLAERRILADVVEAADAFVHVTDLDGNWIAMNCGAAREFDRVFGVMPQVGDNMFAILADKPHDLAAARAAWEPALAGEEYVAVSHFGQPGAERAYEMRFRALRDADGTRIGTFQFVYDVTEKLAEQARFRATEEALRQAHKMEAVGQLTGGLAHDFNNLLAGISGSFEMIGTRLLQGRGRDVERYLEAGRGATRRAAALTHRLLAFSRRQTLTPTPLVLNRLMTELIELVRRTVGPAVQVEMVAAAGLWPALVDANQLENAILNLCLNARDAMPEGGRITIETGNKWIDRATAAERGLEPGQYVTISVSDTGSGIDKDTLERVFDPFFTTKPQGEGTGLGLSMVYGFARQSNGHVRIYSEVGQGTTVCLYLPRHVGEAADDAAPPGTAAPLQSVADVSVVVVDDEPTVRMLVVDALEDLGYSCAEAGDGAEGLAILQNAGRVDILITDVGLPGGMNGRQVAEAARALRPDIKILFITGYAENAVLNHGHIERGMEVLTKPFAVGDLTARVDRLLRSG